MADISVINSSLVEFQTPVLVTKAAATETVVDTAQVFILTPTHADYKSVVHIVNADALPVTVTMVYPTTNIWGKTTVEKTFTCAQGESAIELENGRFKNGADGTVKMSIAPGATKALLTDHALTVAHVQNL